MFFEEKMSFVMINFIQNLSWSFIGSLISSAVLFISYMLIGRVLGPEEYGKFSLLLAVANFIMTLMLFGLDTTSIKFISKANKNKNLYLSNAFWLLVMSVTLFCIGAIFIYKPISIILKIDETLLIISFILAIILTFKMLLSGFIRALDEFKYNMIIKIIESIIVITLILIFYFLNFYKYYYFVSIIAIGSLITGIIYFNIIRHRLNYWHNDTFEDMKKYLRLTMGVSFVAVFLSTFDKFFITKSLGMAQLGLYSAYLMSSIVIVSQLTTAFMDVFFPTINKIQDKQKLFKQINKIMLYLAPFILIIIFLISFLSIKLFGSEYPINYLYLMLVSVIALCHIWSSFYGAITSSSKKLFKITAKIYFFKPLFMAFLYISAYFIMNLNLTIIFIILLFSYFFDIINTIVAFKRNNNEK